MALTCNIGRNVFAHGVLQLEEVSITTILIPSHQDETVKQGSPSAAEI